jgi:hypothetical protein
LTRQEFDDVLFFKKKENPNDNENLTTFFLFFFVCFPPTNSWLRYCAVSTCVVCHLLSWQLHPILPEKEEEEDKKKII